MIYAKTRFVHLLFFLELILLSSLSLAQELQSKQTQVNQTTPSIESTQLKKVEEEKEETKEVSATGFHAALGEGQTLPKRIARFRYVNQFISGDYGFNQDGRKSDHGIEINVVASALVFEYGITDRLSMQMMAPFIVHNDAALNSNTFRSSYVYKQNYEKLRQGFLDKLETAGLCHGYTQCRDLFESGHKLPHDFYLKHEAGSLLLDSNVEPKKYIDSVIHYQSLPSQGSHGLGDIEMGLFYNFFRHESFIVSAGIGTRAPTGSYSNVPLAYRPTGAGIWDLGLRYNLDYQPTRGLWLSLQEQQEIPLSKAKRKPTSLEDNTKLADGDYIVTEEKGIRRKGFVQAAYGLGVLHDDLRAFVVNGAYLYKFHRSKYSNGEKIQDPAQIYSYAVGGSIDGRGYQMPLALDVSYENPIAGKQTLVAPSILTLTLKAYAKF